MMAKICRQCRYFYLGHKGKISLCTNRHSDKFPDKVHHDGHNRVCRHFRPPKHKHPLGLLETSKLKRIESFRGIYTGREIWVFATGSGLDDIPVDFLKVDETIPPDENGNTVPKICIAVKQAAMLFPDCTYNLWTFRDRLLKLTYLPRGLIASNFNKFIFSIRKNDRINFFGKQSSKATFIRFIKGGTIERMKSMCDAIVAGNSSVYYGVETIMHLAIASALVMGATKISLVGCDHGAINGRLHFQMPEIESCWSRAEVKGYEIMKPGTNFLADYFRDHGVEIVRYYHGKGYEAIGKALNQEFVSEEIKRT